jgi:hypothetical protein
MWVESQDIFIRDCGLSRDACKALIVAAAGIGAPGITSWRRQYDVDRIPPLLNGYLEEYHTAAQRDVKASPGLVAALKDAGVVSAQDVTNKVFYLKNSEFERARLEEASHAVSSVALVASFEYNGLVLKLLPGKTWAEVEARLSPIFRWKPYRPVVELMALLSERAGIDATLPAVPVPAWMKFQSDVCALGHRLRMYELPVLLAAAVLPDVIYGHKQTLQSTYKAGPGKCAGMSFFTYTQKTHGGYWVRINGARVLEIELGIVKHSRLLLAGTRPKFRANGSKDRSLRTS